jgi:uncharacterized membrane protein
MRWSMAKIRKSVSINAPLNTVFAYMTHPENLLEIWPSMIEVSNVKRKEDGAHDFDWVYKMAGMRFKGHSETIEAQPNARVVLKNEGGIPSTFTWTYAAEGSGTKLTVEVEYTLPGKLLDKLATPFLERVNEREAETLLANAKERIEVGEKRGGVRAAE